MAKLPLLSANEVVKILKKMEGRIAVDVNGFGLMVNTPLKNDSFNPGDEIFLHTYLSITKNGVELYGFKEHEGRELFKTIIKVPGVFDMPLAVKKLLEEQDIDAVVTIGAVIEGETEHDDVVIQHTARKITDLAVEYNKPVGLGITGPGMTRLQASTRIDRAKAAVESVVKLHKRIK